MVLSVAELLRESPRQQPYLISAKDARFRPAPGQGIKAHFDGPQGCSKRSIRCSLPQAPSCVSLQPPLGLPTTATPTVARIGRAGAAARGDGGIAGASSTVGAAVATSRLRGADVVSGHRAGAGRQRSAGLQGEPEQQVTERLFDRCDEFQPADAKLIRIVLREPSD